MDFSELNERGLVLVGCGRMGGALLERWLDRGLDAGSVWVLDPGIDVRWQGRGLNLKQDVPDAPGVIVLAVKPQVMDDVLRPLSAVISDRSLVISVAAGVRLADYDAAFAGCAVVRTMPNTPAAIGQGVTALIGNDHAGAAELDLARRLMSAVGRTVLLEREDQMDAVTALSGSGPAYVFHMIEAMAVAGEAEGLPHDLALELARATVAGAGALAVVQDEDPAILRENVTSPGGTTAAGLERLMVEDGGLTDLMRATLRAAAERSRALGA